jgi:hypothetical protein
VLFENFSSFAQHDAASGAMVVLGARFLFKRLHPPAQDRLADRKANGCARERAGLRDGDEAFELPQFLCEPGSVGEIGPRPEAGSACESLDKR